jgi:hypothetical protein
LRLVWSRPASRNSRSARTTTSRAVPTASAKSCWLIAATSSGPSWLFDARSIRWRAIRVRTVVNAFPGISAMNDSTRSLSSSIRARATRASRSAACRTTDGRSAKRSALVIAWVDTGNTNGDANNDTTPIRAPGRQ